MLEKMLPEAAEGISGLRAFLVITMPDCLLYASWSRDEMPWSVEDASSYFGDLVRSNRRGLRAIGAWTTDMQVTIEGADALVVLRELNEHFVCCALFERTAALGMVRLQLKMLLDRVSVSLPKLTAEERPKAVRLLEFIERYAPDPHAALLRIATRTGLTLEVLRDPAKLDERQVQSIEEAGKRILGLEKINL